MDAYLRLAKATVSEYLETGKVINPPDNLPKEMLDKRAGVFVSLHTKSEELRGCIGTYLPTRESIGLEIIHNAIESATSDPRFPPITKEELPSLIYSVDVLSEPELIGEETSLDPKRYGLIIKGGGGRRGLLLPDLPGVETIEQQIVICRQKAWIAEDEPVTLYRFTVERHGEK